MVSTEKKTTVFLCRGVKSRKFEKSVLRKEYFEMSINAHKKGKLLKIAMYNVISARQNRLEMVARAMELFGGVDLLVNNAGVAVVGDMGELPLEDSQFSRGEFVLRLRTSNEMRTESTGSPMTEPPTLASALKHGRTHLR